MATLRLDYFGGSASEPTGVSAETGFVFNREDSQSGTTTPVPKPTATGTNYSWKKNLALKVTAATATSISNRTARWGTSPTSGLFGYFKDDPTYSQPASGNKPTDSGTNGATPATYTALTTTGQSYQATSVSAGSTGRNGDFCVVVAGIDNTYAGAAGSIALPDLIVGY